MVCGDCVHKLALRLARNHKLDWITANMLALKGMERYERRTQPEPEIKVGKGNPTDYTLTCTWGTCTYSIGACTKVGLPCVAHADCDNGDCACSGACGCPAPKPNSHLITPCNRSCLPLGICGYCYPGWYLCIPVCSCGPCPTGFCEYDCDVGYVWNPVTQQCEPPAPPIQDAGVPPQKVVPTILDDG